MTVPPDAIVWIPRPEVCTVPKKGDTVEWLGMRWIVVEDHPDKFGVVREGLIKDTGGGWGWSVRKHEEEVK